MTVPAGVRVREAEPADAAALLALKRSLDLETSFMLLEPDEEHDIAADLAAKVAVGNSVVMLAVADGRLIGYAQARGGRFRRRAATARVLVRGRPDGRRAVHGQAVPTLT
jgi:hypothetical protein